MIELPLFPLNTVLFPGMPLELHIFEERYKEMIGMCIEKRLPFGIVLLESGQAELPLDGSAEIRPFLIGCTAHITQVRPLPQGRMNITVVGKERFVIRSLSYEKPYLVGMIDVIPIEKGDLMALFNGKNVLMKWIERYLQILESAGQIQFDPKQLPGDVTSLIYLGAVLLQGISMAQKQKLLATQSLSEMTQDLITLYRREVVLLEAMLSPPVQHDLNPFSLN
ncbi:MAG: LON peptidase substrate-binding domain-containing protein [Anaerolineae bacterium]|jgi:Lon protease-like protein|nr:LON peptidase substrate-binding domain-containing protein [Anaerolineae bacterium]